MSVNDNIPKNIRISIITVCLNAEKTIREAIESVLSQNNKEYEYIIMDGGSDDLTVDRAKKYQSLFAKKNIDFYIFTEKDHGIYDAMNKGLFMARGEWIYFLNSDDKLAAHDVLDKFFSSQVINTCDYIYGGSINQYDGKCYFRPACKPESVSYRIPFVHQAVFAKRDLLLRNLFDTRFLYAADFNQFVKIYMSGYKIGVLDFAIAKYAMEGVSQDNILAVINEQEMIRKENGLYFKSFWRRKLRMLLVSTVRGNACLFSYYTKLKEMLGDRKRV